MKKDINNILGETTATSIEEIVNAFSQMNITPEEIAEKISNLHELARTGMHITAMSKGYKELADKINAANEIITQKRIIKFKQAVANNTHEEFLSTMTWTDKISLQTDMGLSKPSFDGKSPLTKEEQKYFDIIEQEALSQGFDSIEAWQEHNGKMTSDFNPDYIVFTKK